MKSALGIWVLPLFEKGPSERDRNVNLRVGTGACGSHLLFKFFKCATERESRS